MFYFDKKTGLGLRGLTNQLTGVLEKKIGLRQFVQYTSRTGGTIAILKIGLVSGKYS